MTKEELLEDVQIGDIVKIYTESDETFEGTITDFGESGLKITLLNSNKAKRIMYGRITEYDIEDVEDREAPETADTKAIVQFDRNTIFDEAENDFDLEKIRGEWVSRLDSKQKSEYNRIVNILNYAKK